MLSDADFVRAIRHGIEDFRRLLREGKRPDGSPVNEAMPVRLMKNLGDDNASKRLFIWNAPARFSLHDLRDR